MAELIHEAADEPLDRHMIEAALYHNLKNLDAITGQLLAFLFAMCGGNDEKPATSNQAPAKPVPLKEFYARLFRIGTGWLGWSPSDTWSATPGEILEAYAGRTELLQAIFGGATDTDSNPDFDAPLDRDGLEDLKALGKI